MAKANEIKYLTAIKAEKRPKKYCRFKKMGIRYIGYHNIMCMCRMAVGTSLTPKVCEASQRRWSCYRFTRQRKMSL